MPLNYVSICIALYDYTAQNDDEISFKEDDILYILENDDDEWWKAKLKIEKSEGDENTEEGQIGLVPSNYIQEAECKSVLKAVYDYEAQSDEELSFKEDNILYLYDKDDSDWYLVKFNDVFGFIPANYVEESASDNKYVDPLQLYARKVATQKSGTSSAPDVKTWSVSEVIVVDKKKKKKKGKLSIGGENSVKYEKKNVTIKFGGPKSATFNFHTSNKSDAEAIYRQYEECAASLELPSVKLDASSIKSPRPSSAHETEETESQPDAEENEAEEVNEMELPPPKVGIALYDFDAQGDDEISIREGDEVWVIDDVSSDEWWKCRKGDEEGMVPSSYIEIRNDDDNADQVAAEEERQPRPPAKTKSSSDEAAIKKIQTPTNRILPDRPAQAQSKDKPLPSNTRIWTDRTGSFRVEAEFLQLADGKVQLHKLNGIKIAVPIDRMSKKDLAYLEERTGEKLDDKSDNIPLAAIVAGHKGKTTLTNKNKSEYDWFDFFLKADITHDDAFRYAEVFINEKMDESSINNLDRNVMKELGLREGDIIRFEELEKSQKMSEFEVKVQMKRDEQLARELQEEENRKARSEGRPIPKDADLYGKGTLDSLIQRDDKTTSSKSPPLLFSENNGVLKNNTKKARPTPTKTAPIQVDAKTFVNTMSTKDQLDAAFKPSSNSSNSSSSTAQKFDDDAWKITDSTPAPPLNNQLASTNISTNLNTSALTSLSPAVSSYSSNSSTSFHAQPSQPLIQQNLAPPPPQPIVVPLNSTLHQPLIPVKSGSSPQLTAQFNSSTPNLNTFNAPTSNALNTTQFSTSPNLNSLSAPIPNALTSMQFSSTPNLNTFSTPNSNALTVYGRSNSSGGFPNSNNANSLGSMGNFNNFSNTNSSNWNNSSVPMLPTNNTLSNPNPGFGPTGINNQYMTTTTTVQYHQTTSFHQPMQNQQQTNSSIYDPKNVFASMKSGQIGPKTLSNDLGINASADRYAALKQVNPQGPSVFNNTTSTFQTQSSTSYGLNPSGFNANPANWNQGVPLGQQPGQFGPNQQGFGTTNTGYNNQQHDNFNQGGFNNFNQGGFNNNNRQW
ncbi:5943_t:CDS:10 [Dentiscutata erythropus]|uniref:Actin cytoskeleton-regulatory complex protein SLA1 n=1 Tax=Dentiscutata erythropus TaxID=1348616 RepID=A0A9N8WMX4_9GLOM|nr:5943_t:CDS:10 [Dentiscutata erythropus]